MELLGVFEGFIYPTLLILVE